MWQNVIVGLIVLAGATGVVWFVYRLVTGRGSCECRRCPYKHTCEVPEAQQRGGDSLK
ncbi:MAG: hypothetical protein KAX78_05630 [Phycisphaerae bacterium]|nr:hypothetical protein [Phycisphaerae bacterium]